jgi:DNA polymerase-3 subunit delta'
MLQRLTTDLVFAKAGLPLRYFIGAQKEITQVARLAEAHNLAEVARWFSQQKAVAGHPLNARLFVQTALERLALACRPTR